MSDFNLLIKIRNGRMLKKMREHGFYTAASLSRATGVHQSEVGRLLMLKSGPIDKITGDLRKGPLKICEVLNSTMADLWPASMCDYRAPSTDVEVDLSLDQVAGLLDHDNDPMLAIENRDVLDRLYDVLNPRERRVVELRNGDGDGEETLGVIAKEFGVTRERIRQIEAKAYRKMRDKARKLGLMRRYYEKQSHKETAVALKGLEDSFGWPDTRPSAAAQEAPPPMEPNIVVIGPSSSTMHYPTRELLELKERLDEEMAASQKQKEL